MLVSALSLVLYLHMCHPIRLNLVKVHEWPHSGKSCHLHTEHTLCVMLFISHLCFSGKKVFITTVPSNWLIIL